jgi:hypothetical protein
VAGDSCKASHGGKVQLARARALPVASSDRHADVRRVPKVAPGSWPNRRRRGCPGESIATSNGVLSWPGPDPMPLPPATVTPAVAPGPISGRCRCGCPRQRRCQRGERRPPPARTAGLLLRPCRSPCHGHARPERYREARHRAHEFLDPVVARVDYVQVPAASNAGASLLAAKTAQPSACADGSPGQP